MERAQQAVMRDECSMPPKLTRPEMCEIGSSTESDPVHPGRHWKPRPNRHRTLAADHVDAFLTNRNWRAARLHGCRLDSRSSAIVIEGLATLKFARDAVRARWARRRGRYHEHGSAVRSIRRRRLARVCRAVR